MSLIDWMQTIAIAALAYVAISLVRDTLEMDRRTRKLRAVITAISAALNISIITEEDKPENTLH